MGKDLAVGTTLGGHVIEELLGAGGMGTVYAARQRSLKRRVALKVLSVSNLASPESMRRFEREGELQAKLIHPHLVTVFDRGREGDLLYISMELVAGRGLGGDGLRLPFEPARGVRLIAQVASALAYLHGERVLHRDVKPANILVTSEDAAKLGDFGLARELDMTMITQAEGLLGTIRYLSPEVLAGENFGAPADVYALGLSLIEVLTGKAPFGGMGPKELSEAMKEPERLSLAGFRPPLRPELVELVAAMVDAIPTRRPTAAEVADMLEEIAAEGALLEACGAGASDPGSVEAVSGNGSYGHPDAGDAISGKEPSGRAAGGLDAGSGQLPQALSRAIHAVSDKVPQGLSRAIDTVSDQVPQRLSVAIDASRKAASQARGPLGFASGMVLAALLSAGLWRLGLHAPARSPASLGSPGASTSAPSPAARIPLDAKTAALRDALLARFRDRLFAGGERRRLVGAPRLATPHQQALREAFDPAAAAAGPDRLVAWTIIPDPANLRSLVFQATSPRDPPPRALTLNGLPVTSLTSGPEGWRAEIPLELARAGANRIELQSPGDAGRALEGLEVVEILRDPAAFPSRSAGAEPSPDEHAFLEQILDLMQTGQFMLAEKLSLEFHQAKRTPFALHALVNTRIVTARMLLSLRVEHVGVTDTLAGLSKNVPVLAVAGPRAAESIRGMVDEVARDPAQAIYWRNLGEGLCLLGDSEAGYDCLMVACLLAPASTHIWTAFAMAHDAGAARGELLTRRVEEVREALQIVIAQRNNPGQQVLGQFAEDMWRKRNPKHLGSP